MAELASSADDLRALVDTVCDGGLTEGDASRLEQLLHGNTEAQQFYFTHVCLERWLRWEFAHQVQEPTPHPPPIPVSPSTTSLGTLGFLSSGWPVAYLIATVIVGIGLWISSVTPTSYPQQIAKRSLSTRRIDSAPEPRMELVGRITGMADCRWSKDSVPLLANDVVPAGRQVKLETGLMEITYESGAKVILQGPVTYEVESPAGGFLSLGKLTAKVESTKSQDPRPRTQDPNPKSPNLQVSKFVVRTPTATVTDLGTEFGVEVNKGGTTTSHVFRGSVRVQMLGIDAGRKGGAIVLHENEAVRTERTAGGASVGMRRVSIDSQVFVRHVVQTPKPLDLLDIVAGGYGTIGRRERGISPATGLEDPFFVDEYRPTDGAYRPIVWHKLIDGVLTFRPGSEPTVLDSDGHTFDGFPRTYGGSYGSIWARAPQVPPENRSNFWVYTTLGEGKQYMPEHRGLLCMNADAGITFNLEAMRETYPGTRPARFRAVAGAVPSPREEGLADIWVFVDGRVKLRRTPLRDKDGVVQVNVELGPRDRFLTLVTTASLAYRNPSKAVVFGDPVLERIVEESSNRQPRTK
jgi:hypothetical protein